MKRLKQIGALLAIAFLIGFGLGAMIFAFIDTPFAHKALTVCLYTEEIKEVFAHCEETITPLPYAESWVRSLKEKGYRLYILSNYSGDLFERTKEKMPFLPYMDGTLFSYTCHLTKPEPEIYQHLIQKFSLTPDRCVFLDDTKANVEAAEQAGIHGIHFMGYEDGVAQLKKLGVL